MRLSEAAMALEELARSLRSDLEQFALDASTQLPMLGENAQAAADAAAKQTVTATEAIVTDLRNIAHGLSQLSAAYRRLDHHLIPSRLRR